MTKTKKGEYCKRGLPLLPVLCEWRKLNERIADEWHYWDVPWWYNERASFSVLAGAIWNSGEFAFEEFSDEKRRSSPRSLRSHKLYNGRVDLYFNIRGKDFIAEAKICWPRCGRLNFFRQNMIENSLADACRDIRKSKPYGQRRLGMLFVAPRWRSSLKHEIDHRIDVWISRIKEIDCDAMAWTFPAGARRFQEYGYIYPGVAVFIKEVKR